MNVRRETLTYLNAVSRNPKTMGSVAPSSPSLARQLATVVPSTGAPTVVELGAGTGAVTQAILDRLPAGASYVALDVDPTMVDYLRNRFPSVHVEQADAAMLDDVLAERGITSVDAVVSGLPWAVFGARQQEAILTKVMSSLAPDGVFTTFAYLHALPLAPARSFRRALRTAFDEVLITRVVWGNLPPAFTYVCRRPRRTAAPVDA
ncbi:Phospholipid N-methyltransferase [Streptoalloteichus tenebrarius]|uniref:Phospholipid N-methyltransferase n=1 Tax=Streptoalloteichus tenebrarius (strain ATCC 17920 / DSM 40477 / JCM 4838 / CBS 697.72 / NBRC 16177 / NCIMB 11028 / NRRL B-12390 / A12253. 1 / ISP 5477) TaxID=1933 RepID=A0ABT1I0K8_STRSD|nr:L-histidine N(alpha)-methyltransferase [Streptoalloteichus tenebrarius]MCP2261300.1 Phospholipid N-methyltransferase [Streptoalloteichus tenebrarius]BFF03698.1 methyltransferase domain-containing protein [Streptoalloteichus tenebrarius]